MISGNNYEGYNHAIEKTWKNFKHYKSMPWKSALSIARGTIPYLFFRDIFDSQIKAYDPYRPKYKGLYIYAIDEDALHIPCSKDILKEGYWGAALIKYKGKERETYFPRMYLIHAYDVISGTSKNLKYSNKKNQTGPAFEIAKSFEKNS